MSESLILSTSEVSRSSFGKCKKMYCLHAADVHNSYSTVLQYVEENSKYGNLIISVSVSYRKFTDLPCFVLSVMQKSRLCRLPALALVFSPHHAYKMTRLNEEFQRWMTL